MLGGRNSHTSHRDSFLYREQVIFAKHLVGLKKRTTVKVRKKGIFGLLGLVFL